MTSQPKAHFEGSSASEHLRILGAKSSCPARRAKRHLGEHQSLHILRHRLIHFLIETVGQIRHLSRCAQSRALMGDQLFGSMDWFNSS